MATIDGVADSTSDASGPAAQLGKRKRSASPEKKLDVNGEHLPDVQQALRRKLQALSRYVV